MTRKTPTVQQRMLAVLADGKPHRAEELHACLMDEMGASRNIRAHLTAIRKQLRPKGEDIVCVFVDRKYQYRWVRLLQSAVDGRF